MKITIDDRQFQQMVARMQGARMLRQYAMMVATRMHELISPYPPATEANKPSPGKTHYQRGFGTIYTRKSGGQTRRKTSEMLNRRWDIVQTANGARLRNNASYAGYVHMSIHQAWFHRKRGWQTEQDALNTMNRAGDWQEYFDIVTKEL
jgi:hypothetical protein